MIAVVIVDAGPLINFLRIDRADLLGAHSARIVITDHVESEVTDVYPAQLERLQQAIELGWIAVEVVHNLVALELFAELSATGRLGRGECAAIAHAIAEGHSIAMDDRRAIKAARTLSDQINIMGTGDMIVDLIRGDRLSIEDADRILVDWSNNHRFRLPFASFSECL